MDETDVPTFQLSNLLYRNEAEGNHTVNGLEVAHVAADQRGADLPAGKCDQDVVGDLEAFFDVVAESTSELEQDMPGLPKGLGSGVEQPVCSRKGGLQALNQPLVCESYSAGSHSIRTTVLM